MQNKDEILTIHTSKSLKKVKPENRHLAPNYDVSCDTCSQTPTVGRSGMCGACYFGEADCIDPDNW